jgi:hypothetical protein
LCGKAYHTEGTAPRSWRPPHGNTSLSKQGSDTEEVDDGVDKQEVDAAKEVETPVAVLVARVMIGERIGKQEDDGDG